MDYLSYWSLRRKPFAIEDDRVFFAGVPQREAIAGLNYFVTAGLTSALLVAPPGCGMTSLLRYAKRMRGFGDYAAEMILTNGSQTTHEAVQAELCRVLGYPSVEDDVCSQINRAIEATSRQGVRMIWLIDRCNTTAADVARELVSEHSGLSAVIGAAPNDSKKLALGFGRCGMQIDLTPLSIEDTIEYLQWGVDQAGGRRRLFPDHTSVRLHEMTRGLLADLAVAAESTLALAASHRMDEVTPAIVEAIDQHVRRAA